MINVLTLFYDFRESRGLRNFRGFRDIREFRDVREFRKICGEICGFRKFADSSISTNIAKYTSAAKIFIIETYLRAYSQKSR